MNRTPSETPPPLTLLNILSLLKRKKRAILLVSCLCGLLMGLFALTRPLKYQAEATFRDRGTRQGGGNSNGLLTVLLSEVGTADNGKALIELCGSRELMAPVIRDLGLQLTFTEKGTSFFRQAFDNTRIEWAYWSGAQRLRQDLPYPQLCARKVSYEDEVSKPYQLIFVEGGRFHLESEKGEWMGEGELGKAFSIPELKFTLSTDVPAQELTGRTFLLTASALPQTAAQLKRALKIKSTPDAENIFKITFRGRDRHCTSAFVNGLMKGYQEHLKQENATFAKLQFDYLKERQRASFEDLTQFIFEHADILSADLPSSGIFDTEKEIQFLMEIQQKCHAKLSELELKQRCLEKVNHQDASSLHLLMATLELPPAVAATLGDFQLLRVQRESLESALASTSQNPAFAFVLEGMSLESTHALYLSLIAQRDQLGSLIKQNRFILKQLEDPLFEISSLANSLKDEVSRGIISQAGSLVLHLMDSDNRSEREQQRLRHELTQQRNFLSAHLNQSTDLLVLEEEFLKDKIQALQRVQLSLIHQQMEITEGHWKDFLEARLHQLETERELVGQTLGKLRYQMAELPKRWASERLMMQKFNLNRALAEEVAKLVESNNISNNLETIKSAPIDYAVTPLFPVPPHLILFSLLGLIFGAFLGGSYAVIKGTHEGLTVSAESLQLAQQHVAGPLGREGASLETLRRLTAHLCQERNSVIFLMMGKGTDYSDALATLLSKRGERVLKIDLSFSKKAAVEELPGILQVVEGETLHAKMMSNGAYDFISSGGISPYRSELICSQRFRIFLDYLKMKYDVILLAAPTDAHSAEAECLSKGFDKIAATVGAEKLQDIAFLWQANSPRLVSFLLA